MDAQFLIDNISYSVDFSSFNDLSIPINFNGKQPNTYGVDKAISSAYEDGKFIGDTRKGGPCNFETYSITPHCNGTHTECIGHITDERISILSSLNSVLFPSTLISITPKSNQESYVPKIEANDFLITKESLEKKLNDVSDSFLEGLIIRTLPNLESKKSIDYMKHSPSFFTLEAMKYIRSRGVKHLMVDTPSVDRLFDDGHLSCHNIFWDTTSKKLNTATIHFTITEMIYVNNNICDGSYFTNLQIPAFNSDAAPSRPIIFSINEL